MNWQLFFVLALVSVACFVDAKKQGGGGKKPDNRKREKLKKPREDCVAERCTKNTGKSAIEFRNQKANGTDDKMTLLFDAIRERDANGTIVGKKGKLKHSLESFAPIEFLFTPLEELLFNGAVNSSYLTFSADIPGSGANMSVNMYFFKANGSSDICENQTFSIYPGMVKFDITIEGWTFCTPAECKGDAEGEFLDFVMTFQKKGKAKRGKKKKNLPKGKKAVEKLFIGDQDVGLPSYYELDGDKCGEMPEGYPMIIPKGAGKYSAVFRFPKFAQKVFYDPTVGDARDEAEYTDTSVVDQPTNAPPAGTTPAPGSGGSYILPSLLATTFLGVVARLFF